MGAGRFAVAELVLAHGGAAAVADDVDNDGAGLEEEGALDFIIAMVEVEVEVTTGAGG